MMINNNTEFNKINSIQDVILNTNNIDILTLTETWLRPGEKDRLSISNLTPAGYKLLHGPRQGKKGGGVAVVHKANMTITKQPTEPYGSFEHMDVLVKTNNEYIRLCVLYRLLNRSVAEFVEDYELHGSPHHHLWKIDSCRRS